MNEMEMSTSVKTEVFLYWDYHYHSDDSLSVIYIYCSHICINVYTSGWHANFLLWETNLQYISKRTVFLIEVTVDVSTLQLEFIMYSALFYCSCHLTEGEWPLRHMIRTKLLQLFSHETSICRFFFFLHFVLCFIVHKYM
jgi:hypothetical protein